MATSDLKNFTRDEDLIGYNFARILRLISKILLDWCTRGDNVTQTGSAGLPQKPAYLTAIYFDKLAEFVCRLWDKLYEKKRVRYPSALISYRGFHGPGRAIKINRNEEEDRSLGSDPYDYRRHKLAYTTEIAEKLKPSLGNARILFKVTENPPPWDYRCRIYPQLDPSQWESWLLEMASEDEDDDIIFLSASEVEYINEISRLICLLNKEEIRAIGTHQSGPGTCRDIRFNLRSWNKHFCKIILFLEGNNDELERSGEIIINTASEVLRKSKDNRRAYKSAFDKICSNIRSPELREVFLEKQKSPREIWEENEEVIRFRETAQNIVDLSVYCRGGLVRLGEMPEFKKTKEKEEADACFLNLKNNFGHLNAIVSYEKIDQSYRGKWASDLEKIKMAIFRKVPYIEERRHFGIDYS